MNNLALLRAMAAATPPGLFDAVAAFGSYKPVAKHKPEHVPDWVQQEKIRKAQDKRDRKAQAQGKLP